MNPKVTVIICTFNRGELLTETIPTIFEQSISNNLYQVLIVNNNSSDDTSQILDRLKDQYDNLSVINEATQGLGYAKNAGTSVADAEWLIFLDDDAKVPNDFVEKSIKNIDNSQFQCFGGVYLPWYKYGKPNWFHDNYASNKGKLTQFQILKEDFISGGVMAIKKSVLKEFGGFPVTLGMMGRQVAYGEETLLQIRLRNSGIEIGYDPHWIIYHLVSRYKLSPWWFIKGGFVSGRDAWQIYEESVTIRKIITYFFRSVKLFFLNIYNYTPKLFNKNYYWQNWIIDVIRPTILKLGQIKGGLKLLFKKVYNDK